MGTRRKLSIIVDAEYQGRADIEAAGNSIEGVGLASEITSQKMAELARRQRELADAVRTGEKSFDDAEQELKDYKHELGLVEEETVQAKSSFARLAEGGAALGVALGGVATVAKFTYDTLNQGAQIQMTADKFDSLAKSIGANATFLEQLRAATKGTRSDVELMAGASDLMGLGFVKNQEQAVRLTAAVGDLNMDMNALGLTIANETTARFDTLNISTEGWKETLAETKAAGGSFTDALIIQSEKQVAVVGSAADSMVGDMQRIQAAQENITNSAKKTFAAQWAPILGGVSDLMDGLRAAETDLDTALAKGLITQEEHANALRAVMSGWRDTTGVLAEARDALDDLRDAEEEQAAILAESDRRTLEYTASIWAATEGLSEYAIRGMEAGEAQRQAAIVATQAIESYQKSGEYLNVYAEAGLAAAESSRQQASAVTAANEQYTNLSAFLVPLKGNAENTAEAFDNLAVSIVNAELAEAVAAGQLTAEQAAISSVNVQQGLGLIGEAEAEQLREAAIQFGVVEEAITLMADEMVSAGGITVEEAEKMEDAILRIEEGAQSSGEVVALMAMNGGENLAGLTTSFLETENQVGGLEKKVGTLKDLIIDGLPDEKLITIRIQTIGALPELGQGNNAASATGVADSLGR